MSFYSTRRYSIRIGRRSVGDSCVLVETATAAVVGGTKELWAPSYVKGRQAWTGGKEIGPFLPPLYFAYRSTETGHLRHLPECTLATKNLQGNPPPIRWRRLVSMIPRLLPAFSVYTITCPLRHYRKNREQRYSTLTCYIMQCLAGS